MPPTTSKKCGPRNHIEARSCICGVCFLRGVELKVISIEIEALIQTFVNPSFSLGNNGLPNSICGKSRLKLTRLKKVILLVCVSFY